MQAGFLNSGFDGTPRGFDLREIDIQRTWLLWEKMIYEFTLNVRHPLTYVTEDGRFIQPDKHFQTDQGSLPPFIQPLICAKDRAIGFYIHDSAYTEGGMYVSRDEGKTYKFEEMLRENVDALLFEMCKHDPRPLNIAQRYAIWCGVRIGGGIAGYNKGDYRRRINRNHPPIAFA